MVRRGWAPKTQAGYSTAVRRYTLFAALYSLDPLPLTEFKLLCFSAYLDSQGLSHTTVRTYLSGLRAWVLALGFPEPKIWTPKLQLLVKAMDKSRPPPRQPRPITFTDLISILAPLSQSRDDMVIAGAIALQFFACLRASELTQVDHSAPYPLVSSLSFHRNSSSSFIRYRVRKSKTAVHGFVVCVGCSGHPVCAVCLIRALLATFPPPSPDFPLFQMTSGLPLSYSIYNTAIKTLAARAGMDPSRVSSHSLRPGV